jgi:hypothetical protein
MRDVVRFVRKRFPLLVVLGVDMLCIHDRGNY